MYCFVYSTVLCFTVLYFSLIVGVWNVLVPCLAKILTTQTSREVQTHCKGRSYSCSCLDRRGQGLFSLRPSSSISHRLTRSGSRSVDLLYPSLSAQRMQALSPTSIAKEEWFLEYHGQCMVNLSKKQSIRALLLLVIHNQKFLPFLEWDKLTKQFKSRNSESNFAIFFLIWA